MIINLLFCKSGKGINSILKNQTEKPNTNVAESCVNVQETLSLTLFERQKISGCALFNIIRTDVMIQYKCYGLCCTEAIIILVV